MGRPTVHTPELAREICERLAGGESLVSICKPDAMPSKGAVICWVLDNREGFADQYARARKVQAELLADELFTVADDGSNDWQEGQFGPMLNSEAVGRSRLRVDTRKWYLSKVLPKIYGDKLGITDGEGGPLQFVLTRAGKPKE